MPELPEAETIVRGLRARVVGRRIRATRVVREDVVPTPADALRDGARGRILAAVERRGKNVVLRLDDGSRIVINLGMTGRVLPVPADGPGRGAAGSHPAVVFELEGGGRLVFDDVRRFGRVEHLPPEAWRARDRALGPEPLARGFTARRLHEALGRSRSPARSWLLDQRRIAGVGNIYANEALFLAGIHPRRPARSVGPEEAGRLHRGLRRVLRGAIEAGGTTLRDYRNAEGGRGSYGFRLRVYGRAGEPCVRCGDTVERLVFSNRSSFLCPTCQPWSEA